MLPQETLCKIYFALFHSHFLYGLVAWGSTFPTDRSKLESLQNKAVKIIDGDAIRENPTPFYGKLKMSNFEVVQNLNITFNKVEFEY